MACLIGLDIHRCAFRNAGRHLACHRSRPDEAVELVLLIIQIAFHVFRRAEEVSRADSFVRFLGVLRLGGIHPRVFRQIFLAIALAD